MEANSRWPHPVLKLGKMEKADLSVHILMYFPRMARGIITKTSTKKASTPERGPTGRSLFSHREQFRHTPLFRARVSWLHLILASRTSNVGVRR